MEAHFLKVKISSCHQCGRNQKNHFTPVKLRNKIQAKKVSIEQGNGTEVLIDLLRRA